MIHNDALLQEQKELLGWDNCLDTCRLLLIRTVLSPTLSKKGARTIKVSPEARRRVRVQSFVSHRCL